MSPVPVPLWAGAILKHCSRAEPLLLSAADVTPTVRMYRANAAPTLRQLRGWAGCWCRCAALWAVGLCQVHSGGSRAIVAAAAAAAGCRPMENERSPCTGGVSRRWGRLERTWRHASAMTTARCWLCSIIAWCTCACAHLMHSWLPRTTFAHVAPWLSYACANASDERTHSRAQTGMCARARVRACLCVRARACVGVCACASVRVLVQSERACAQLGWPARASPF